MQNNTIPVTTMPKQINALSQNISGGDSGKLKGIVEVLVYILTLGRIDYGSRRQSATREMIASLESIQNYRSYDNSEFMKVRFKPLTGWPSGMEATVTITPSGNGSVILQHGKEILQQSFQTTSGTCLSQLRSHLLRQQLIAYAEQGGWVSGQNFSNIDLSGIDLQNIKLSQCDLSGTQLSKANLNGATISLCDLRGATFVEAELSNTEISNCLVNNVVLTDAFITKYSVAYMYLSCAEKNQCDPPLEVKVIAPDGKEIDDVTYFMQTAETLARTREMCKLHLRECSQIVYKT